MHPESIVYLIPLAGMAVGSLFMVGVYRLTTRWMDHRAGRVGAGNKEEIERLQAELAGLPDLQHRVAELEERLDFAERLLARGSDPERLPGA